ncbi:MAG: MFS transporter [Caldilineales bacterium]|nr:MFS transporter [Caldilineales bacterium]
MSPINVRARNRILLILFLGVLMGALDIAIVAPALPAIQKSFAVDDRALAWVFTTYVLFNLIGTPLMAKLADAWGRRPVYVLDVGLFALGSLLVALAPGFAFLLAGRALQGFGAGGVFPVASAVIGDTFPPEKRGSALGMIGAVFGLAFLIGPVLGIVILRFAGWPWLFLINLPIALVVILAAMRFLPGGRPAQRRRFDAVGMVVLGASLAALTYGINRLDTARFAQSITSPGVWPFLAGAVLLLPVFWVVEQRAEDPILRVGLFRRRQIAVGSGLALGAGLGEAAVVFVPALLVAAFGISESRASALLLPAVLAMAVGSPLAGRMLDRFGSRPVVFLGSVLVAAGMLLVGLATIGWTVFYASAILVGLGLGILLGAPLRYIMLNEAPLSDRASAQGALTLFTATGQLIGGALVGAVAASAGGGVVGYQSAYTVVGVVAVALALLALALKRRSEELATVRQNERVRELGGA